MAKNPMKLATQIKEKPTLQDVVDQWASEGFEEGNPYASGWGKGVFHQGTLGHYFGEDEDFTAPVKTHFDFGSASKKKAIEELNNRIKGYGLSSRVGNPEDDSGNDYILFEKLKEEMPQSKQPRRTDIEVWRDRANKYLESLEGQFPQMNFLKDLNDDDIQEMIDLFGFDRRGE